MPRSGNVTHIVVCSDIRPICNGICAICSVCRLVADTVGCRLDLHIARDRIDRTVVDNTIICFGGDRDIPCDRTDAGRLAIGRDLLRQLRPFVIVVEQLNLCRAGTFYGDTALTNGCANHRIPCYLADYTAVDYTQRIVFRADRHISIDRIDLALILQSIVTRRCRNLHGICDLVNSWIIICRVGICPAFGRVDTFGEVGILIDCTRVVNTVVSGSRILERGTAANAADLPAIPQRILRCASHFRIPNGADLASIRVFPRRAISGTAQPDTLIADTTRAAESSAADRRNRTTAVEKRIVWVKISSVGGSPDIECFPRSNR